MLRCKPETKILQYILPNNASNPIHKKTALISLNLLLIKLLKLHPIHNKNSLNPNNNNKHNLPTIPQPNRTPAKLSILTNFLYRMYMS